MPDTLPADIVVMERAIVGRVKARLLTVPHMGQVHLTERWPETDEEDVALTTTPDPLGADLPPLTNYVEIGLPTAQTSDYSGDDGARIVFNYPISYTLGVRDLWAEKAGFPYRSSSAMFVGTFLRAMQALAQDRTLNFVNVWCELLSQDNAYTITNEDGEALEHGADWGLTIAVQRLLKPVVIT
jgi:hypothetical protein